MIKSVASFLLVAAPFVAGCASDGEFLAKEQPEAPKGRAGYETSCVQATGKGPSTAAVQAIHPESGALDTRPVDGTQYTIGVAGCGKRKVFVLLCPYGDDGCFVEEDCGPCPAKE